MISPSPTGACPSDSDAEFSRAALGTIKPNGAFHSETEAVNSSLDLAGVGTIVPTAA